MKPIHLLITMLLVTTVTEGNKTNMPTRLELHSDADPVQSPYTGYTRDHWLEITERLIAGFLPYFDKESGLPNLEGAEETGHYAKLKHVMDGQLEAFGRSLVMVGYYIAATGQDRVPGYQGSISKPYIDQIRKGTDPDDPGYWGAHKAFQVNGTNLALIAQICPEYFWDPFTEKEKENILVYLQGLTRTRAYDNNHWYFHMVPVPLLEKHGLDSNRDFLTEAFDRCLGWYRGDGWYIDGSNGGFDYYNLWGFQIFNNMLAHLDGTWRAQFGDRIERHTQQFLKTFPYLFGKDGGPIPFGRSTPYRFAINSSIGWALLNGTSDMDPGAARRIASGCLKYFWEHGAMSKAGLLEPGFHGPNTAIAESYTERGSPYWAVHGLVPLLLPEDHPFWTSAEQPMPADGEGGGMPLPHAQMLLHVRKDGDARMYPVGQPFTHHGQWQRGIKYCQLGYSSLLGWCATGEGGPDLGAGRNGFSYNGDNWNYRAQPRVRSVTGNHLVSEETMVEPLPEEEHPWFADFGEIITHTLVGDHGEVHVFWHTSTRPVYLYMGGYGISIPHGKEAQLKQGEASLSLTGGKYNSVLKVLSAPGGKLTSNLVEPREGWNHSHLFGGRGSFPSWRSEEPVDANQPVVFFVDGTRDISVSIPEIQVTEQDSTLIIHFEGTRFEIDIPE